jgi:hypothetical protein
MRCHFLAATLAAVALVSSLWAQQVFGGPDPDRRASTVFVSTDKSETLAAASISYSQADWHDDYDGLMEKLKGAYTRLGRNWWTTLDTIGALEIGGTKIDAGSYYLGLAVGQDGAFRLLVFDSMRAMKSGLLPAATALYTGEAKADFTAPLTLAKNSLKNVVVQLEIEITADKKDPATGDFSIRWGKHELSAPVRFHLARTQDAAAPKK